jgi:hypothetical protein
MRKTLCVAALALTALAAVPAPGEAFGRRGRHGQCAPECWTWCQPVCPPCYPYVAGQAPWGAPTCAPSMATAPAVPERSVTIQNKRYRIIARPQSAEEREREAPTPDAAAPGGAGATIPSKDKFKGTARRIAKTTIFDAQPQPVTLDALLDELVPTNDAMRGMHISSAPTSNRVDKEKRNVTVSGYVYAYKKESDNDYHVIFGTMPTDGSPARYMNTEVSGIPIGGTDENRKTLWAVRKAFEGKFELNGGWHGGYDFPDPPVPVRITGSLFWDVDHQNEFVGPGSNKPETAWEIHPISAIEFLPPQP